MMRQEPFYYDSSPAYHQQSSPDYNSMSYREAVPQAKPQTAVAEPHAEEVAGFLLSLKHSRSVSPDPSDLVQQHPTNQAECQMSNNRSYSYDYSYPNSYQENQVAASPSVYETPVASPAPKPATSAAACAPASTTSDLDLNQLLDGSPLVLMEDRDLVPDALFVAMAQMKTCYLTQADRVGCYKSREIGFKGMCCKHCGGQPGFGRYYPNSVRSLAQTTTSQTILKHIGSKCRFCPPEIRLAVLELQREQAVREGLASGRPRYGSRKIFFQRVWARLHGAGAPSALADDEYSKVSSSSSTDGISHSDCDERSTMSGHSEMELQHYGQLETSVKRKNRFGSLPLQKNKRSKIGSYEV